MIYAMDMFNSIFNILADFINGLLLFNFPGTLVTFGMIICFILALPIFIRAIVHSLSLPDYKPVVRSKGGSD